MGSNRGLLPRWASVLDACAPVLRLAVPTLTALAVLATGCSVGGLVGLGDGARDGLPGELLIQHRNEDGVVELFELEVSSGERTRLTHQGATAVSGAWSPDGTRVVYAEQPAGDPGISIRTMNSDGTGVQTISEGAIENYPTWSPDCSTVAFMMIDMFEAQGHLVLATVDGTRRSTLWSGPGIPSSPEFSPDGTRIVLQAQQGGDAEIVVVDVASGALTVLTANETDDSSPTWSPDGTQIAYSGRSGPRIQLFVVDAAGGEPTALTDSDKAAHFAVWSPDGEWIAFERGAEELSVVSVVDGDVIGLEIAGQPTDWGPKSGSC